MGGKWSGDRERAQHKRARAAGLAVLAPGAPCVRCGHEMWPAADILNLDHNDAGTGYLGFSHSSPCRTCGKRCNQSAGGVKGALAQGKRLRQRACVICGRPFTASRGRDGAVAATCSQRACLTALRAIRRQRQPDPEPPAPTGRVW